MVSDELGLPPSSGDAQHPLVARAQRGARHGARLAGRSCRGRVDSRKVAVGRRRHRPRRDRHRRHRRRRRRRRRRVCKLECVGREERGKSKRSEALRCNQCQSVSINGNQWQSVAISYLPARASSLAPPRALRAGMHAIAWQSPGALVSASAASPHRSGRRTGRRTRPGVGRAPSARSSTAARAAGECALRGATPPIGRTRASDPSAPRYGGECHRL